LNESSVSKKLTPEEAAGLLGNDQQVQKDIGGHKVILQSARKPSEISFRPFGNGFVLTRLIQEEDRVIAVFESGLQQSEHKSPANVPNQRS